MLFVSGLSTGGGGATTSPLWHKPTQLRGSSNSPIPATTNRPVPPSFVLLTPIPKSWRGLANPAHKRRQPRTRVSCFPDPFSSPPAAETMVHVRLACLVCLRRTVRRTAILLGSAVRASMPSSRVEDGFVHRPTSVPSWDLPFNRGIHARFDSVRFPRDSGGREGGGVRRPWPELALVMARRGEHPCGRWKVQHHDVARSKVNCSVRQCPCELRRYDPIGTRSARDPFARSRTGARGRDGPCNRQGTYQE